MHRDAPRADCLVWEHPLPVCPFAEHVTFLGPDPPRQMGTVLVVEHGASTPTLVRHAPGDTVASLLAYYAPALGGSVDAPLVAVNAAWFLHGALPHASSIGQPSALPGSRLSAAAMDAPSPAGPGRQS